MSAAKTETPASDSPSASDLKRDRLAGAGGTGNEPMPVREMKIEHFVLGALADDNRIGLGRIVDHRRRRCTTGLCGFCHDVSYANFPDMT